MNYIHYDLGSLKKGRTVEVHLQGKSANIKLLDSRNYFEYENGRTHDFIGGYTEQTPIKLKTTHYCHWHIVADMKGIKGTTIKITANILP